MTDFKKLQYRDDLKTGEIATRINRLHDIMLGEVPAEEVINKYDPRYYGATGDGTTDDVVELQAALDSGYKYVNLGPSGLTYLISSPLDIPSGTVMISHGAVIKADADFGNNPMLRNETLNPTTNGERDTDIVLWGLRLDGNSSNNSTGTEHEHCIGFYSVTDCMVAFCYMTSPKGDGVYIGRGSNDIHSDTIKILHNFVDTTTRNGIAVTDGRRISIFNNHLEDITIVGIDVEPDNSTDDIHDIRIQSNDINSSAYSAIQIDLVNTTDLGPIIVHDNIIDTTTDATNGNGIQIRESSAADFISVQGNQLTNIANYGIHVFRNSTDNQSLSIKNNTISGATDASIYVENFIELSLNGNDIFANTAHAIYLNGGSTGVINGNLIHQGDDYYCLYMEEVQGCSVSGNEFKGPGNTEGEGIRIIQDTSTGIKNMISGNVFYNLLRGIYCAANTSQNLIGENVFDNCGTDIYDDGSNHPATLTVNSATPSVANGIVFKTANTSSTTITTFNNMPKGKRIWVIVGDANTTFNFEGGGNLKGNGSTNWTANATDFMSCVYDGTYIYCDVVNVT